MVGSALVLMVHTGVGCLGRHCGVMECSQDLRFLDA